MSIQEKVEHFFNNLFGKWALVIVAHPCKVFWFSMLFFVVLSGGMALSESYEDGQVIWTPAGNPSLTSKEKGAELFPSKGGFMSFIAEVKVPSNEGSSIITVAALNEIKSYVDQMNNISAEVENKLVAWTDICNKVGDECISVQSILTFGYDPVFQANGPPKLKWNEKAYESDQKFLEQLQSGKNKAGKVVELKPIIGGTVPEAITQDTDTGSNDLKSAKAAMVGFPYSFGDLTRQEINGVLGALEELADDFNEESKEVNIYLFTQYGFQQSFVGDIMSDLGLVQVSVALVAVYCIIFMGGWSPIHFRSAAAGITLLCVGLSYGSSQGLAFLVGGKTAGVHNLLPFLLIGIGVDDMFVISSNIDQTNPRWSIEKRMMVGLQHAGTSITITSFTNAIAFFLGCTSSLEALASFCFFAGLGVMMLYLTSISIFSAFMVFDIKRQNQQKGDCCGACTCKEDTMICCKGFFLTASQKSYPYQGQESDPEPNEKYANGTQKFLHQKFSKVTTSKAGIIVILSIWLIYIAISIYGIANVTIDFKQTYFIGSDAYIRSYLDRQDEYFKSGSTITVYTDAKDIDITSYQMQANLNSFNSRMNECEGCTKKWTISGSINSWYDSLTDYAKQMTNSNQYPGNKCLASWNTDKQALVPEKFMGCLIQFLKTSGAKYSGDINMNQEKTSITSFKQSIKLIFIEDSASDGVEVLNDMRDLCEGSKLGDTFTFTQEYFNYETYVVFTKEAILNIALALVAVFVILMIVTANLTVTLFIVLCVALVDLFLLGLLDFWDVTLNSVTIINNVIAIGLAVDYSAHIGHSFLQVEPPEKDEDGQPLSNHQKRVYKARGALGQMGSSVFHGAFSTLLAIIVLSPSQSYIFKSFFKMWFGIIIFGVGNGFILLPVLLSLCGPLNTVQVKKSNDADAKTGAVILASERDQPNAINSEQKIMMEGGLRTQRTNQVTTSCNRNDMIVEDI